MTNRHLFLFSGSPPFSQQIARKFSELSLKSKGKVAILFIKRDGWEEYLQQKYTSVLQNHGLKQFSYIALTSSPDPDIIKELKTCTGVIISGGETELYRLFIVDTIIGKQLVQMYQEGIPMTGFSAGALISPETCVIPPIDNRRHEHLFLKGLGLIKDCVVSVHFSQWNEEKNLKFAIERVQVPIGYGIDDEGSLHFKNGSLIEEDSKNYYIYEGKNV